MEEDDENAAKKSRETEEEKEERREGEGTLRPPLPWIRTRAVRCRNFNLFFSVACAGEGAMGVE